MATRKKPENPSKKPKRIARNVIGSPPATRTEVPKHLRPRPKHKKKAEEADLL